MTDEQTNGPHHCLKEAKYMQIVRDKMHKKFCEKKSI